MHLVNVLYDPCLRVIRFRPFVSVDIVDEENGPWESNAQAWHKISMNTLWQQSFSSQ